MNCLSFSDSLLFDFVEKPFNVHDAGNGYIMIESWSIRGVKLVSLSE